MNKLEKAEKDSNNIWKIRWEKFKFNMEEVIKELPILIILLIAATIFWGLMFAPGIIGLGTR